MEETIASIIKEADSFRGGSGDLTLHIQDDFGPMYTEVFMDGWSNPIGVGGTPTEALAMALDWAKGKREEWEYLHPSDPLKP